MTIDTFLANAKRAVRDRETVSIGGGEFSPAEITTVIQAITMLRGNAYVLTDSDNAFVQSYNDSFGVFANNGNVTGAEPVGGASGGRSC